MTPLKMKHLRLNCKLHFQNKHHKNCSQDLASNKFDIFYYEMISVINKICVKHFFSFVVSYKRNKPLLTDDKAVIVKGELYQVALEDK